MCVGAIVTKYSAFRVCVILHEFELYHFCMVIINYRPSSEYMNMLKECDVYGWRKKWEFVMFRASALIKKSLREFV